MKFKCRKIPIALLFLIGSVYANAVTIENASFENGLIGWTVIDPAKVSYSNSKTGEASLKIQKAPGRVHQWIDVSTNTDYILTAYVGGNGKIGVNNGVDVVEKIVFDVGNRWTKITLPFNSKSKSRIQVYTKYNKETGKGYFDDISIVEASVATDPVTTDPVTTDPVTTDPVTTDPVTTDPVTTDPITTDPITTDPVTTDPVTTDPITTDPVTTDPVTTDPITTDPITTDPITTDPVTTDPVTTDPVTTDPVTTDPVTTDPITIVDEYSITQLNIEASDDGESDENYSPDKAIDGFLYSSSRWSSKGEGKWLLLDLGGETTVDYIATAWYSADKRTSYFDIETSIDGLNWNTEILDAESQGNESLNNNDLNGVDARYVRLIANGNSSSEDSEWNSLLEIKVFGNGDYDLIDKEIPVAETPVDETPVDETPVDETPVDETPVDEISVTGDTHYTSADNLNSTLASAVGGDEIIVTDSGEISIKNVSFDSPVLIRAESIGSLKLENATISNSNNITLQGFKFGPSNDVSTLVKIVNSTNIKILRNYFDHLNVTEGQTSLVMTQSSQYIEIGYNEFHDKNISVVDGEKNTGSYIKFQYDDGQMTKNAHIHHNYFNNITPYLVDGVPAGDSDREAIVMGISSSQDIVTNNIVEYNLFENCDGENEILTIKTSDNTFRYNTFKNSMGSLSFRLGHDNKAYGNYFYGTGKSDDVTDDNYQTGGIRVYGSGHSVYDNYMEGLSGTSWRLPLLVDNGDTSDSSNGDSHQTPTDVTIHNNTIVDSVGGGIYIGREDSIYSNAPTDITITDNIVVGSEGILFNNDSSSAANTWSNNAAYATGSATENGGTTLTNNELQILTSEASISVPTPLTADDVGTNAQ